MHVIAMMLPNEVHAVLDLLGITCQARSKMQGCRLPLCSYNARVCLPRTPLNIQYQTLACATLLDSNATWIWLPCKPCSKFSTQPQLTKQNPAKHVPFPKPFYSNHNHLRVYEPLRYSPKSEFRDHGSDDHQTFSAGIIATCVPRRNIHPMGG